MGARASRASNVVVAGLVVLAAGCAQEAAPPREDPSTKDAVSAAAEAKAPAKDGAPAAAPAKDAAPAGDAAPVSKAPLKPDEFIPPLPKEPVFSPFGDPWDPTRPAPVEPQPSGPGITAAKLVAAGAAEVKELPRPADTPPVFYAVVADVTLAPGSTTQPLGPASVTLAPASGDAVPLFAACLPTFQDDSLITNGEGTERAGWTILIGEQSWICRGGSARMIRRVSPAGFKLTGPASPGWTGPLVMLFEGQAEPPKSVSITGTTVEIPPLPEENKS